MAGGGRPEQLVQENHSTHRTGCLAVLLEVADPIDGLQCDELVGLAGSRTPMTSPRLWDVLEAKASGGNEKVTRPELFGKDKS